MPAGVGYSKRLDFRGGDPVVSVRLMEGQQEATLTSEGRVRLRIVGPIETLVEGPGGSVWAIRIVNGQPAVISSRIQLAELAFEDKQGMAAEQKLWEDRGLKVRVRTIGSVYGIRGKVIDNRRYLLLLDEKLDPRALADRQASILRDYSVRTTLCAELEAEPTGSIEVRDPTGKLMAAGNDRVLAEPLDGSPLSVRKVEFGIGYDFHGFEDRSYRGWIEFTVDRNGQLAVVNLVKLEELLKGLVPAEIFPRSPLEALKAQAVTARGEVLAKIGTKHLADPYLLCAEQHCAVYKGLSGEAETASAAVDATRGEALFSSDGHLVDSVYSAVCGGHTEDNEVVWGGLPNPSLRGKPDLLAPKPGLPTPEDLSAYLAADLPAACRLASLAPPNKYRWERRFTAQEMDELVASLKLGQVRAISIVERGISGRARLLTIAGERGAAQIRGELSIRRLFGMLNSAAFTVAADRTAEGKLVGWVFRGAGWGHGVGMCQTGAIGRAEAGHSYRTILRHYFSGATVDRIY
jgi:SpoIID/LytB domain protein